MTEPLTPDQQVRYYEECTTVQLRALLRDVGLPVSGTKIDLVRRLVQFDTDVAKTTERLEHFAAEHSWTGEPAHVALTAEDEDTLLMSSEHPDDGLTPSDPNLNLRANPTPPLEQQPATVIIVGSYDWELRSVVADALINWWVGAGQPPVQLVTSGCPQGAEAMAREIGESHGWTSVIVRDEDVAKLDAIAFAFLRDESEGASEVTRSLLSSHWVRVFEDKTSRVIGRWSSR